LIFHKLNLNVINSKLKGLFPTTEVERKRLKQENLEKYKHWKDLNSFQEREQN